MLYTITRNGAPFFTHEIKGNRTKSAPAVDFIDIEFDYFEPIEFQNRSDELVFKGQSYHCDKQYNSILKQSSNLFKHRARFLSENYKATDTAVLDQTGAHVFEIEGNLLTLLTLAVNNLNRVSAGWSYNTPATTVTKTFQVSDENVMSFLAKVSSEFEIPFDIQNRVIYFRDPSTPYNGDFKYGKGNGFLDLRKSYKSNEKIANTIYASGGNGLTLDAPITDSYDIFKNGIVEGFYANDRIFPTTRTQVTGSLTANNIVGTNLINYDINSYKIPGQAPLINFETGALGGLSFFITKVEYDAPTNVNLIYIKRRTVDGIELPNNTTKPAIGDFFNITNITQPTEIVDEAKSKLEIYATDFLRNGIDRNLAIEASVDPLFSETLNLSNRIRIVDESLDVDGYFIINEITENLQELNKKDITLEFVARKLFTKDTLHIKNENIIDLSIENNYDDLVKIQDEVSNQWTFIGEIDGKVSDIENIKLPSKQDNLIGKFVKITDNEQFITINSNETVVNLGNFTNVGISKGFSDGNMLVINTTGLESMKTINIPYVDKDNLEKTTINTMGGKTLKFIWVSYEYKWKK